MIVSDPTTENRSHRDVVAYLRQYRKTSIWRSLWQLASTLLLFVMLWIGMWFSLRYSYFITLLLALPTGAMLVRLFVLQHDCGHGSFFASKRQNDLLGTVLGVLTLTPYHRWRKRHAVHHASSGDLDRRGWGDVTLATVQEYRQMSRWQRLRYRIERHPLILFGFGAFLYFAIWQRFTFEPKSWRKERLSVHVTNLGILALGAFLSWWIGIGTFLAIHLPVVAVASSLGVWLFFVQHHFEDTYWRHREDWNYYDASFEGCSHYNLPSWLRWLTANIGLHHIHHLDSHIPNYQLQACFEDNPSMQRVRSLSLRESLSCLQLRLWDEDQREMVPLSKISV